jgi:hypothetical protein
MSVQPVSATAVVLVADSVGVVIARGMGVRLGVNKENGFCLLEVFSYDLATYPQPIVQLGPISPSRQRWRLVFPGVSGNESGLVARRASAALMHGGTC